MRVSTWLAGTVTALLVLTGCAGGELSREELVARADAICARTESEVRRLRPPNLADLAAAAAYFGRLSAIAGRQFRDLRGLKPPTDLKPEYDAYLARGDRNVRALRSLRAAARAGDGPRTGTLLARLPRSVRAAESAARKVGLDKCAS